MSLTALANELEEAAGWRIDELRHLRNMAVTSSSKDERRAATRALVVLGYSHCEGYVSDALRALVRQAELSAYSVGHLADHAAAAIASERLRDYRMVYNQPVSDSGSNEARFRSARTDAMLLAGLRELLAQPCRVMDIAERIVILDSNLSVDVLKRSLFRVGMSPDSCAGHHQLLSKLVVARNHVAHGNEGDIDMYFRDMLGNRQEIADLLHQRIVRFLDTLATEVRRAGRRSAYVRPEWRP